MLGRCAREGVREVLREVARAAGKGAAIAMSVPFCWCLVESNECSIERLYDL
jgi:hypothetical protein